MKTIVAISSTGQRGKTSSIVELAKNIPWEEAPEYYNYDGNLIDKPAEGWVLCRGKYRDKTVGLSSEGDTWEIVNKGLCRLTEEFSKDINVIVAACRTKGSSPGAIRQVAWEHRYEMVWTSHYRGTTPDNDNSPVLSNGTDLNDLFEENMLNLIKELLK